MGIETKTISTTGSLASTASVSLSGDNMSPSLLEMLSFDNSSTSGGLLDGQYWDTVFRTSRNTTVQIIPNTVYGFQQTTNEWTRFFPQNIPDPPPWLSFGLGSYTRTMRLGSPRGSWGRTTSH